MGFTTCKEFKESGHTLYCGHRDGTAFNGMKDCAYMPKNQTLWGFGHEEKCQRDCKALKKFNRFDDGSEELKDYECLIKGMVRKEARGCTDMFLSSFKS